jgi:hypothetical protein
MQLASIANQKTSFPAGKNQHRRKLFSFLKPSITDRKKTKKKKNSKTGKKKNPNSKSFLAK